MAIVFTPTGESAITMGGASSGTGLVGPFPRWSISREETPIAGSNYAPSRFTININGTAVIKSDDSQDITDAGERQSRLQGEAVNILRLATGVTNIRGVLEISPYGGKPNTIRFNDARLVSAEVPEQTEESSGVQTLDYSFSFEAYDDASNTNNTGNLTQKDADYWIASAEESWDFTINEDSFTYENSDPSSNLNKTFTMSRNLSATGLYKLSETTNRSAVAQAKAWVESRLFSVVPSEINPDLFGNGSEQLFLKPLDNSLDVSSYTNYSHTRTNSLDLANGSYAVTDTWTFYKGAAATHDIDVSIDSAIENPSNTISVSLTVQGINTNAFDSPTNNAYANALTSFNSMRGYVFTLAQAVYSTANLGGVLDNTKISESIGHNKTAGTITYSVSYNDLERFISGASSENITINDDNEEGLNQVIAKLDIIGKADGPIIQDMSTTTIKSRSVTVDLVMKRENRANKPSSDATSYANLYKPVNSYQQSKTESWSPKTGTYNLNITWEYI